MFASFFCRDNNFDSARLSPLWLGYHPQEFPGIAGGRIQGSTGQQQCESQGAEREAVLCGIGYSCER